MSSQARVAIAGSEREFHPEHERVGDADSNKQIDVTVYLQPAASLDWVDDEARRPPANVRRCLAKSWQHATA